MIFYIDNYKIEKSVEHMSKKTIPFEQASQTVRTQVIDIMQKNCILVLNDNTHPMAQKLNIQSISQSDKERFQEELSRFISQFANAYLGARNDNVENIIQSRIVDGQKTKRKIQNWLLTEALNDHKKMTNEFAPPTKLSENLVLAALKSRM